MKRIDGKDARYYDTPLGRFPSVTTILGLLNKPALVVWSAKMTAEYIRNMANDCNDLQELGELIGTDGIYQEARNYHKAMREQAAELGSEVHRAISEFIKTGEVPSVTSDAVPAMTAFFDWMKSYLFMPLDSEVTVYSRHGYAGTLDCPCIINKRKWIIDFKTGKGRLYHEHELQVVAYMKAWNEMTGDKVRNCGVLLLDKETGEPTFHEVTDHAKHYKAFLCLVKYWQIERGK